MTDQPSNENPAIDAERLTRTMTEFAERSQRIVNTFLERQQSDDGFKVADPAVIGRAFLDLTAKMLADPAKLAEAQAQLWTQYANLWQSTAKRLAGEEVEPVVEPARDDKRFKDDAWNEETIYDFIKQSYLLTSNWMQSTVREVDGLDDKTREKVDFYTRQFVDAMAPSNFAATNPKVVKKTIDSGGENLLNGLSNLLSDLEKGEGDLRISMTDVEAFTPGQNIAVSPGKVVFQNELMQLLQYAPSTEKVFRRPLLIVPPWINKFYILDLQPRNSFIKWAVDQGHTVFVISWVNPDEKLAHKGFDDYMIDGPLAAMDAIEQATGEREINLIGYCIGGTLTASTLAYMAVHGDDRVASATYFTTMIDFEEPGELGVFIDEEQLEKLEAHMAKTGYLEGRHMAQAFNMMRDNDLIWSFVVNNYLMGREPMAFDLLYWNADSTRMPAMMHGTYLRKMYLENKLKDPGGITLADTPIDLSRIKTPTYILATKDDHIAPWTSAYRSCGLYSGPVRFVLAASGHIAGVINPPVANKYCHWTRTGKPPAEAGAWFYGAKRHDGSWWPDWQNWVKRRGGGQVAARQPGDGRLKAIEDAPGSYVTVRLE